LSAISNFAKVVKYYYVRSFRAALFTLQETYKNSLLTQRFQRQRNEINRWDSTN